MKATLINPPSPFLIDQRVFPYLGILQVATQMQHDGHDVNVVDLSGIPDWEDIVRDLPRADMYGVTSTTAQFKHAHKIGQMLQGRGKTVIGGTHVNNLMSTKGDEENKADLEVFDTVFKGEGENYEGVMEAGQHFDGGMVKDLDDLPMPDRNFLNIDTYHYELDGERTTTLLTQRGCPYRCNFCSGRNDPMYNRSRQHSPERVAAEMEMLQQEHGFKGFMWFDDEININPGRLEEIAKLTRGKGYKQRGFLRSDLIVKHPESLDYLKQMGFVEACIGVESGSNEVLKRINKGTTREAGIEAVKLIKEAGMRAKTFTMIGHPGETYEDVMATKNFLLEAKPDSFDIAMHQPYPGSNLYNEAQLTTKFDAYPYEYNGLYFDKVRFAEESPFHKGIPGTYRCHVRTDELTADNITELRDTLEKEVRLKLK